MPTRAMGTGSDHHHCRGSVSQIEGPNSDVGGISQSKRREEWMDVRKKDRWMNRKKTGKTIRWIDKREGSNNR